MISSSCQCDLIMEFNSGCLHDMSSFRWDILMPRACGTWTPSIVNPVCTLQFSHTHGISILYNSRQISFETFDKDEEFFFNTTTLLRATILSTVSDPHVHCSLKPPFQSNLIVFCSLQMALLILKWPSERMGDCLGDWRTTFSLK